MQWKCITASTGKEIEYFIITGYSDHETKRNKKQLLRNNLT